jgi:hypothetical protein
MKEIWYFLSYMARLSISKLYSTDGRLINKHGAVGGMKIGKGVQNAWRKPGSVSVCQPQIPWPVVELTWTATVGSWQLTI